MTKTPEELTASWKAKKLKTGWYYVVLSNGFIDLARLSKYGRFYHLSYSLEVKKPISIVPNYDECKAMQDHIVDLTEKVERLKKELESSHWYQTIQNEDISNLRNLLRECWAHLSVGKVGTSITPINILLTQINTALNETRANPTDCNKMQESEA